MEMGIKILIHGMGIDQWEWEGMGIVIVFPHTSSTQERCQPTNGKRGWIFWNPLVCGLAASAKHP